MDILWRKTGIPFPKKRSNPPSNFTIQTAGASKPVQELGEDESYHLKVSRDGVELTAANPLGVLHGLQTFLQLVRITPQGFAAPAVTIDDQPRFPWRGLMIDSGRHFMPMDVIERNLDGMEAVKLNVFHWHLSDDQGFRVESKVVSAAAMMKGSNGLYYTQKDDGRSHRICARPGHPRGSRVRHALPHDFVVCRLPATGQRLGPVQDRRPLGRVGLRHGSRPARPPFSSWTSSSTR